MCVVLAVSALRSRFDSRVIMEAATVTAKQDVQKKETGVGGIRREKASGGGGGDDDDDGGPALLPWLPWEREAMLNGSCRTPAGVPDRCCVGTSSSGGAISVSPRCLSKGTVRALVLVCGIATVWACWVRNGTERNGTAFKRAALVPFSHASSELNWTH
jgi:hypothetical protein